MSNGNLNEKEWSLLRVLLQSIDKPSWAKLQAEGALPEGMTAAQARGVWFSARKKFMSNEKDDGEITASLKKKTKVKHVAEIEEAEELKFFDD